MTAADHAALVRSALKLDERVTYGNAGPLAALDALQAQAEAAEAEVARLEQERVKSAQYNGQLRDEIRDLRADRGRRQNQFSEIVRTARTEQERADAAEAERDRLERINARLTKDLADLQRANDHLRWQIKEMHRAALAGEDKP